MIEHVFTLDHHPPTMDYEVVDCGPMVAISMLDATQIPLIERYDSGLIVVEPVDIVVIGPTCLDVCHIYDNCHTYIKLLELKCTLTKAVRWNPSTIIWLDGTKKERIDVFKLQALKNDHHLDFQDQRASIKKNVL